MSDLSLLKDLELFQELSEQESNTVIGGILNPTLIKIISPYIDPGLNCPGCISGCPPIKDPIKQGPLISNKTEIFTP